MPHLETAEERIRRRRQQQEQEKLGTPPPASQVLSQAGNLGSLDPLTFFNLQATTPAPTIQTPQPGISFQPRPTAQTTPGGGGGAAATVLTEPEEEPLPPEMQAIADRIAQYRQLLTAAGIPPDEVDALVSALAATLIQQQLQQAPVETRRPPGAEGVSGAIPRPFELAPITTQTLQTEAGAEQVPIGPDGRPLTMQQMQDRLAFLSANPMGRILAPPERTELSRDELRALQREQAQGQALAPFFPGLTPEQIGSFSSLPPELRELAISGALQRQQLEQQTQQQQTEQGQAGAALAPLFPNVDPQRLGQLPQEVLLLLLRSQLSGLQLGQQAGGGLGMFQTAVGR